MAAADLRTRLLCSLHDRFGAIDALAKSQSLFELGTNGVRIYVRYSRIHGRDKTFYGLRKTDLVSLEGRPSFICFLWDGQETPLFVSYEDYEAVFAEASPASDGQYKVQVCVAPQGTELYVARAGRFNVEADFGFAAIERAVKARTETIPALSHSQIQTLLGAIGAMKSFDVWIPSRDRESLDWSITEPFSCVRRLPMTGAMQGLLHEVDAIWFRRGSTRLAALFEVEHSTPVYSGLLRLNDIHLAFPSADRLSIVSNEIRRGLFARQIQRPTFQRSGLSERCTFLEYGDVFHWHLRMKRNIS
ncbi:MAG: hypothetical protein HY216_10895 [Candidatus Rokubacteria bacterium]|nr:hypothetical protein [Candidatus Rokubacteria bacterium]